MRTCPSCGRFITDAAASACPYCGAALTPDAVASSPSQPASQFAPSDAPQPTPPGYEPPTGAPPYAPYAPPPYGQPPYGPPAAGPGYGAPAPYSQPMPSGAYAPPSQPMAPGYGQPTYGSAYGASPAPPSAPPAGQPTYGSGYGGQGGYPGAYRPGVDWKPSQEPAPRPWGRIFGGIAVALVVIAVVVGVYNQTRIKPAPRLTSAQVYATATAQQNISDTLLADSMLTVDSAWANDSHCYFDTDGYHIRDAYICYAPIGNQTDGTESVTAKQITGPTNYFYGLAFRVVDAHNYYFFGVDGSGKWVFDKIVNDKITHLQNYTVNIAIKGGLNTENSLSVTMTGTTFDFYINGQKVGTVHDSTFPEGKWGLEGNSGLNVVFTDYLAHK